MNSTSVKNFLDFSKPFIDAAQNVFQTMVSCDLKTQQPELQKEQHSFADVSASLNCNGTITIDGDKKKITAMMVIMWNYDSYIKLSNVLLTTNYTSYNDDIADVCGEIANIIVGNAKAVLDRSGYEIDMALPSFTEGAQHKIQFPNDATVISIPMSSIYGDLTMELCYKESELED